jgi:glycosyltransferase involved in cell wall biosynthesis
MPGVYHAADLVILPSRGPGETWGLALNEAMACSRAVLASDRVGAAVDLICSGENGWIFSSEDESALVACLKQAIGQGREGLKRMGQVSRSIIADWSIDRQVDAITTAVGECVNGC